MIEINCNNPWGSPVYYIEETGSTMTEMASLDHPLHGTAVSAGFQSSGRGRGELRQWDSPAGMNLLFTLVLDRDRIAHPLLRIPLICALALIDCLNEKHGIPSKLKWPNDVLVESRKIAGILCEYRGGRFYLGMGVNCLQSDFPPQIASKATSLLLQGVDIQPGQLLEELLVNLKRRLETPEWEKDALNVLFRMGETVRVCEGPPEDEKSLEIRITGLSSEGFLIAEDLRTGGRRQISAGEIRYMDL